MSNLGAIQSRMKSIRQTVQIAGAQKLISSSRISGARRMLDATAPYHERIRQRIAYVLALAPEVQSPFLERDGAEYEKRGLLVLSSNTGLAGGYNSNIFKLADEFTAEHPVARLIVLGNVGCAHFGGRSAKEEDLFTLTTPTMYLARDLAERLTELFTSGEVDCFDIVYTQFHSTVRLTPVLERLFPLRPESFGHPASLLPVMDFEPSADALMASLTASYLKGFLYGCLVHAYDSELAARVTAMDNAIRNGNDILNRLGLLYNRVRQAAITQEITEIVAGASAMSEEA